MRAQRSIEEFELERKIEQIVKRRKEYRTEEQFILALKQARADLRRFRRGSRYRL